MGAGAVHHPLAAVAVAVAVALALLPASAAAQAAAPAGADAVLRSQTRAINRVIGSAIGEQVRRAARPAVTASATDIRARPGHDAAAIGRLPAGSRLSVTGEVAGWYAVDLGGRTGYVARDAVR